jgi:cell division protein FtsB
MRMRRRLSESVGLLIVPAICCAIIFYFGYTGMMGPRGFFALTRSEADLAVAEQALAQLRAQRSALQHRISLLDEKALDPDMLEEVARGLLLQGNPGEVTVPRETPN